MKRVLCAGLIGLSLFMVGCGETNNSNTAKSTHQSEQLTAEEKNWTKAGAIEGVRLGTTLEKVKRVIGESPKNKKDINGLERYYFQNVTIDILNGKVVYITTETPQPYYNNKWHEGTRWQDIKSEMGSNYESFSADGMTMYEYTIPSEDKKQEAVLRFAVKIDGLVDYVSMRVKVGSAKKRPKSQQNKKTESNSNTSSRSLQDDAHINDMFPARGQVLSDNPVAWAHIGYADGMKAFVGRGYEKINNNGRTIYKIALLVLADSREFENVYIYYIDLQSGLFALKSQSEYSIYIDGRYEYNQYQIAWRRAEAFGAHAKLLRTIANQINR